MKQRLKNDREKQPHDRHGAEALNGEKGVQAGLKLSIQTTRITASSPITSSQISSVQPLCHVQLCDPMDCSTPGFPALHHLLQLAQTHDHWVSDATPPSHPLSSPSPPAFNLSKHQGLHELALHIRWPKHWSFSISPSNEYSGLISFGIDWFDLLAVRGTLKSLLQHHSSKASILWCS